MQKKKKKKNGKLHTSQQYSHRYDWNDPKQLTTWWLQPSAKNFTLKANDKRNSGWIGKKSHYILEESQTKQLSTESIGTISIRHLNMTLWLKQFSIKISVDLQNLKYRTKWHPGNKALAPFLRRLKRLSSSHSYYIKEFSIIHKSSRSG